LENPAPSLRQNINAHIDNRGNNAQLWIVLCIVDGY
jgi:hypothetical protein